MTEQTLRAIKQALEAASVEDRKLTFAMLRKEFPIHELEQKWHVQAEVILAAIARASDFTQRGIRGVIAEAAFEKYIVDPQLQQRWKVTTLIGDYPYDFKLEDAAGSVTVQVKNQRMLSGKPKLWRPHTTGVYDAETDKSRKGEKGGQNTRRYRFGEFDILAVCLHPSTEDWSKFLYTVGNWLLPRQDDKSCIAPHQPVDASRADEWTSDFEKAVEWFRSAISKTITAPPPASRKRPRAAP